MTSEFMKPELLFGLMPGLLILLGAVGVLLLEFGLPTRLRWLLPSIAVASCVLALFGLVRQWSALQQTKRWLILSDAMRVDGLSVLFSAVCVSGALAAILVSWHLLKDRLNHHTEFWGLLLLSTSGMIFTSMANDLALMIIALELVVIPIYILIAYQRDQLASTEAALKYVLLGSVSTAILAYGFSLLFGVFSGTRLVALILDPAVPPTVLPLAIAVSVGGLLFKCGAVPFHVWVPDAYQGAPSAVTAFLSTASKAAAFVALIRVLNALVDQQEMWQPVLIVAAVASMTLGSFAALTQQNVKRLLAYGSIAHTGYLLLGVALFNPMAVQGLLFYLLAYVVMTFGAFAVVSAITIQGRPAETLEDFAGLAQRQPAFAWLLTIALISLTGIPPTIGFIGKLLVFLALVAQQKMVLVIIAAIYIVVSLAYYLRVIQAMFFRTTVASETQQDSFPLRFAACLCFLATLIFGIAPQPLIHLVKEALSR
jgi:NADH-quinone oxidoreductase subunit N